MTVLARAVFATACAAAVAAAGVFVADAPAVASTDVAIGEPRAGIDGAARAAFERGRKVATRRFAPSAGLGPAYNGVSCGDCHEKPAIGGGATRYRGVYAESGLAPRFVVPFERHFTATSVQVSRDASATRVPSPFFGIGLLAEVKVREIVSRADPGDADGDGISGKANFERGFVGRFGRKSQMSSLQGFVRLALLDHMGITTSPSKVHYVVEGDGPVELPTGDDDGVADPELAPSDLDDLLAFVSLLAPPPPDPPTAQTRAGASVFEDCGCARCHVPALRGPRGPVAAYTDLLLHDMGSELADGVLVGEAKGTEFRTAPLWGVAASGPYLHDGRADTLDEAIRAHGGEASRARARYEAATDLDRARVVAFLESLGGADRRSGGLLETNAPLPTPGALGGPADALTPDDALRFTRGRTLFDHDFSKSEGLGPRFNGDACRSCHFDPVIGGAGPSDVDVVRHGSIGEGGKFLLPPGGDTMAHRFSLGGKPIVAPAATLFERRQTPALFGLGLVDSIDESAIRAHADPDDADGDGVRGAVRLVAGGKVGRFGWKAQLATLPDFVEDALANELGVTRAELPPGAFEDLAFFLARLAPPPRGPRDASTPAGAAAFTRLGCATCHVPELADTRGRPVALYSDLLVHDVAPPGTHFVDDMRAFRTPPLWGIGASAPYFHDGMSETLDLTVRRHDGEATRSRERYVASGAAEQRALLAFLRSL